MFSRWAAAVGVAAGLVVPAAGREPARPAVVVYGATPAGIAAALAAAGGGRAVLLVEPTARVGGMVTNGLSHTDFRTFEGITGPFLDFARRVEAHYVAAYGKDSPQARDCFRGTFGEPHVNLKVFREMLAERPSVRVATGWRLAGVEVARAGGAARVRAVRLAHAKEGPRAVEADVFIDASYEGDLMAAAGVPWRAGREGRTETGEPLAPEKGDDQLQAYNFRWTMTREPANRVAPAAPPGYRRDDFLPVVELLKSGKITAVFGTAAGCVFKAQKPPLPNGKYDINDVSNGLVRLSLPGKNLAWPAGDDAARAKVFAEHRRDQEGLLYFLQNDEAVPDAFRAEARPWGWCKDEFADNGHLPEQLYVREARRMVGVRVYAEKDSEHAPGDARAVFHSDAVAAGDYGNNCHGTGHAGPRFGGRHTGEFYKPVPPYQIPYGVIVPEAVENLLVPGAVSATHVGFCALRLEPIWASLGAAAGHAAGLAIEQGRPVRQVPVRALQARLHAAGSATLYVSDVPPGHADFVAVQWWGARGGFHGLAPAPAKPGQRGEHLAGQYFRAYPGHAAELDRPLTAETHRRWADVAREAGLPEGRLPTPDGKATRGDWVRAAFRAAMPQP